MGRIANALKRAQEERARRQEQISGTATAVAEPAIRADRMCSSAGTAHDRGSRVQADEVLDRIVLPTSVSNHEPFPSHCVPVDPEQVDETLVAFHEPSNAIAEKYRSVRTRLLTNNPTGCSRVFAVSSGVPKEGKTTTVGNLGFSLSELRHLRVAMIDLDFRQRGLSRLLGVENQPGIAEVLRGERRLADVALPVVRPNLHVIPAGDPAGANPSELISGEPAARLFTELNERFHYSLIDTPPIGATADIGLIAPLCHAAILVIRMNRTPEPVLRRSVKMLRANHVKIAGCILSGYEDKSMGLGYAQDYYGDADD